MSRLPMKTFRTSALLKELQKKFGFTAQKNLENLNVLFVVIATTGINGNFPIPEINQELLLNITKFGKHMEIKFCLPIRFDGGFILTYRTMF